MNCGSCILYKILFENKYLLSNYFMSEGYHGEPKHTDSSLPSLEGVRAGFLNEPVPESAVVKSFASGGAFPRRVF